MSGKRFDMDDFVKRLEGKKAPAESGPGEDTEPTESRRAADTEQTESTPGADQEPTKSTQEEDFSKRRPTELERISIRLRPEDIERLREYFESRDLTLSQGIRTVIKDFMERQGI